VASARRILLTQQCTLLPPAAKAQLSDDQVRSLLVAAGGPSSALGPLHLNYLARLQVHCPSLSTLQEELRTLRAESQAYMMDLYLHFNTLGVASAAAAAGTDPPVSAAFGFAVPPAHVETLFSAGGFLTLAILHGLASQNVSFTSVAHMTQCVASALPAMLRRLSGWKDNLVRFLTCPAVNEFVLEEGGAATATSASAGAGVLASRAAVSGGGAGSSPLLLFKVSLELVRHLLYLGASDVQLIFLLTRLYNGARGRQFTAEKRMLVVVRKAWEDYRAEIAELHAALREPRTHAALFSVDRDPDSLPAPAPAKAPPSTSKQAAAAASKAAAFTDYVPLSAIDGVATERLYAASGLNHLTLSVLRSLASKRPAARYTSFDALVAAMRQAGQVTESMASIHAFLNNPRCALFPFSNVLPRVEITQQAIGRFLMECPPGTSIPLVLKECKRFERVCREKRAKLSEASAAAGSSTPSSTSAATAATAAVQDDGQGDAHIPPQFHDFTQLCTSLHHTLPLALAALNLDRRNLALTLADLDLFSSNSSDNDATSDASGSGGGGEADASGAGSDGAPPTSPLAGKAKAATTKEPTTHELDALLTVAYDSEGAPPPPPPATPSLTGGPPPPPSSVVPPRANFGVMDLLALLRRWNAEKRKFASFKALRATLELETGRAGDGTASTAASSAPALPTDASSKALSAAPFAFDEPATVVVPVASTRLLDQHADVYASLSPEHEKGILREFMLSPARRLLAAPGATVVLPGVSAATAATAARGGVGAPAATVAQFYMPNDAELEQLLITMRSLTFTPVGSAPVAAAAPHSFSTMGTSAPGSPSKTHFSLSGIHMLLASLRYLERTAPTVFLSMESLCTAVVSHYVQLSVQMVEVLKYARTARRLLRDGPSAALGWSLQREALGIYKEALGDLDTKALLRRVERERAASTHGAGFATLKELIQALKLASKERAAAHQQQAEAAAGSIVVSNLSLGGAASEGDIARVLAALTSASQITGPSGGLSLPRHRPLMPLHFLDPSTLATEQIALLLQDFPLHQLLQHVASLTHALLVKATTAVSIQPSGVPYRPSLKPLYPTWHALSLALHESVLEANRVRSEVFALLSSPSCVLLRPPEPKIAATTAPASPAHTSALLAAEQELSTPATAVPVSYESVDRLIRTCGLEAPQLLAVLKQLNERGVRLRGLAELAARVKSFHAEQRRLDHSAARFDLVKAELLAYFHSDACHLFLNAEAKANVCREVTDDAATFGQLMRIATAPAASSISGPSIGSAEPGPAFASASSVVAPLKAVLQLLHALEAESQAFDSLESIVAAMRVCQARDKFKRRLLPWINDPARCRLLGPKLRKGADPLTEPPAEHVVVRADDPALNQLLSLQLSETSLADLKTKRCDPLPYPPGEVAHPDDEHDSVAANIECIFEFLLRLNESFTPTSAPLLRFASMQELASFVQTQVEAPLASPTPPPSTDDTMEATKDPRSGNTAAAGHRRSPTVAGYDSDEDVDVETLVQQSSANGGAAAYSKAGPAGLSRRGSVVTRGAGARLAGSGDDAKERGGGGDDIVESNEEREKELARRAARQADTVRLEMEQLARHDWIMSDDDEWLPLDALPDEEEDPDPARAQELLAERRLAIFNALSFPNCQLFSERDDPMNLMDIDLDAVLAAAGGGAKGLAIAQKIILQLDRKEHRKYVSFDQVTLEIARRWQRRKALQYLQEGEGQGMVGHSNGLAIFVLRLLLVINKAAGVDPAIPLIDMLMGVRLAHPDPFSSHGELITLMKYLVLLERQSTLRDALLGRFSGLFTTAPTEEVLTDDNMNILLAAVGDSLFGVLKYLELLEAVMLAADEEAAKAGPDSDVRLGQRFTGLADILAALSGLHQLESWGVPDLHWEELEAEDDAIEAAAASSRGGARPSKDAVRQRRLRILDALLPPKCNLFSECAGDDAPELTDRDLDDVVKAAAANADSSHVATVALAVKTIEEMDKGGLKFRTFPAALQELTTRCQAQHAQSFLLSHENRLLHHSVPLPRAATDPELVAFVRQVQEEGMGGADPYLSTVACLKALNQVPRTLAQAPKVGGYRSMEEFLSSLRSLADEQRSWMVDSYFKAPNCPIAVTQASTNPLTDYHVALMLYACGGSIYFLMRHFQTIKLNAPLTAAADTDGKPAKRTRAMFSSWADVLDEVSRLHGALLHSDPDLAARYTPSKKAVEPIQRPNEAKELARVQQHNYAAKNEVDRASAAQARVATGPHPGADKITAAARALVKEHLDRSAQAASAADVSEPETKQSEEESQVNPVSDAHLQLLSALCFPKSQLFSRSIRPVVVREAQLDALLRSSYSAQAEVEEEARAVRYGGIAAASNAAEWTPHAGLVTSALRLLRSMDAQGLRFASWSSFLREYRAQVRAEKREVLLTALTYPRCKLFSQATSSIDIDDDTLDRMMTVPQQSAAEQSMATIARNVPLRRVLAALTHLDANNVKLTSVEELVERVHTHIVVSMAR
jgi:hypothetical protein